MSSTSDGGIRLQEASLEGVTLIDVNLVRADVTVESNPALDSQIKMLTDSEKSTVSLIRNGSTIRVRQENGARESRPTVVQLPVNSIPPLQCSIVRGKVTFNQIHTPITFSSSRGDLHVTGGSGPLSISVARGDVSISERVGPVKLNGANGDLRLDSCVGPLQINKSSGDMFMSSCDGPVSIKVVSGDIVISKPVSQQIETTLKKGDFLIKDGSISGANIKVGKGDIIVKSRLLLPSQRSPFDSDATADEFDWEDDLNNDASETIVSNAGGLEIEAGGEGLRIRKDGQEIIRAGADGLRIAHSSRGEINMGPDGIKVGGSGSVDGSSGFTFVTRKGDVILTIPDDVAARVELLSNRGDVSSDIALVEVGRPGPKGTTRRYVGATDTADGERLLVRAKSDNGDISIRKGSMATGMPAEEGTVKKDEHIKSVLTALANKEISADEAQTLIAVIERGY